MFAALALVLLTLNGCTKYTTPKKVERLLIDGSWTMTNFIIDGESVIDNYQGYSFAFTESGGILVKGPSFSSSGSWKTGLNKNPAILYLSFAPEGGLEFLADDWQVTEMKKGSMKLKRNGDTGSTGNVTFKK